MKATITRGEWLGTAEELLRRVTAHRQALEDHKYTIGVPAPLEIELVEGLCKLGVTEIEIIEPTEPTKLQEAPVLQEDQTASAEKAEEETPAQPSEAEKISQKTNEVLQSELAKVDRTANATKDVYTVLTRILAHMPAEVQQDSEVLASLASMAEVIKTREWQQRVIAAHKQAIESGMKADDYVVPLRD